MKKIAFVSILLIFVVCAFGDDSKDQPPDEPLFILERARQHFKDKNYEKALKDYSWFFTNSAKVDQSYWAVKLSVCLNEWRALGNVYAPALMEFRKELLTRKERLEKGEDDVWIFFEFSELCLSDGKKQEAVNMFIRIHNSRNKDFAKAIFPLIRHELADTGYYTICNEYIKNPMQSFDRAKILYDMGDRENFFNEVYFLLDVLKENNRNLEYEQLKGEFYKLNPKDEIKAHPAHP
jgi:hypothetical protein